jgi:hypothetical protein
VALAMANLATVFRPPQKDKTPHAGLARVLKVLSFVKKIFQRRNGIPFI